MRTFAGNPERSASASGPSPTTTSRRSPRLLGTRRSPRRHACTPAAARHTARSPARCREAPAVARSDPASQAGPAPPRRSDRCPARARARGWRPPGSARPAVPRAPVPGAEAGAQHTDRRAATRSRSDASVAGRTATRGSDRSGTASAQGRSSRRSAAHRCGCRGPTRSTSRRQRRLGPASTRTSVRATATPSGGADAASGSGRSPTGARRRRRTPGTWRGGRTARCGPAHRERPRHRQHHPLGPAALGEVVVDDRHRRHRCPRPRAYA